MGVGAGLYMYDVVVKSSRSLSHLLMSSCYSFLLFSSGGQLDKHCLFWQPVIYIICIELMFEILRNIFANL